MSKEENQQTIDRIRARMAVHFFCKLKFEESMKIFRTLKTGMY